MVTSVGRYLRYTSATGLKLYLLFISDLMLQEQFEILLSHYPDKNKLEFTSSKNSSLVIWPIYLSNFYPITIVTKLQFTIVY